MTLDQPRSGSVSPDMRSRIARAQEFRDAVFRSVRDRMPSMPAEEISKQVDRIILADIACNLDTLTDVAWQGRK